MHTPVLPLLLLFCLQGKLSQTKDDLLIETKAGPIRGISLISESGKEVDAFLGIPFGKPPLGAKRFRHPEPAEPWTNVLEANEKATACFQNTEGFQVFPDAKKFLPKAVSEDCLKLNIWVPSPRPNNAPVMVFIYGGGFSSGSSSLDMYDMKVLASEENVIGVSINYRISSLGFLYLGHPDAPGNAGLYDQALALQWLKDNIAAFGGDPEEVTIFGESAGSASVGYHLLSPVSRNLFKRAIMQSGTPNAVFGLHNHSVALEKGLNLAKSVNCSHDPNRLDDVIRCLRKADAKHLTMPMNLSYDFRVLPWAPVVDGNIIKEPSSLLLESGEFEKASVLIGTNSEEGSIFLALGAPGFSFNKEAYLTRSMFLNAIPLFDPIKTPVSQNAIAFEYTDWTDPEDLVKNADAVEKIYGDTFLTCSSVDFAFEMAKGGSDVYQYEFRRRSSINTYPKWMGVPHAEEMFFTFGKALDRQGRFSHEEIEFTRRIMRYWANFARTGNPNISPSGARESIEWPKYSHKKDFLPLKDSGDKPDQGLRARRCAFWTKYLPTLAQLTDPEGKESRMNSGQNFSEPNPGN